MLKLQEKKNSKSFQRRKQQIIIYRGIKIKLTLDLVRGSEHNTLWHAKYFELKNTGRPQNSFRTKFFLTFFCPPACLPSFSLEVSHQIRIPLPQGGS